MDADRDPGTDSHRESGTTATAQSFAQSSTNLTRRAIVAYQAGRPEAARELLGEALQLDPANELAWIWLAALAHKAEEKRYCLERACELNPEGAARDALVELAGVASVPPAYVAPVEELPLPKEITREQGRQPTRTRLSRRWLLAVALLALVLVAAVARLATARDTLYLALAAPITGPSAAVGEEMRRSAQLAVDDLNAGGGIDGRQVGLLVYDDQNDPELARTRATEILQDGRALAVLGHNSSAATLAGSKVYEAAGLPSISGTASADAVTQDNPWGFTTIFNNTAQGNFLATYIPHVLGEQTVSIVYSDEPYGRSLHDALTASLGPDVTVANTWRIDMSADGRAPSLAAAVKAIAATRATGTIVLAVPRAEAHELILGLRRQGVQQRLIGVDAIGFSAFAEMFQNEPEEQRQPGFFTDGIYAATPLIYDSAPAAAQELAEKYGARYGTDMSWRGVKVYDSALAVFEALRRSHVGNTAAGRAEDRRRVREQLASFTSRDNGVAGFEGPIYFDAEGAGVTPVAVGIFQGRELLSAPVQLHPVDDLARVDLAQAVADGEIFQVNQQYLQPTRVVYTGATMAELRDLDPQAGTANFDLYLWFRYDGDDDATDIQFVNQATNFINQASNGPLLGAPIEEATIGGLKYRLFRVRGVFKQNLDFKDYPFDRQVVSVQFRNDKLPRSKIIYVVDRRGLEAADNNGLLANASDFANVDNWHVQGPVRLSQDTLSQASSFGDPRLFGSKVKFDFSEFHIDITLGRDLLSFLLRNVLPLGLILAILYISLFFSHEDQTTDRVTTAVTVLLTAAVLLSAIYAGLPEVGYTVAIEYGFYLFFVLALGSVFLALIGSRLYKSGNEEVLIKLDLAARIAFPVIVLLVVAWYVVQFGPRLVL